jgi:hypothetical protein
VARALATRVAASADVLSALLFAAGTLVARDDLIAATGWPRRACRPPWIRWSAGRSEPEPIMQVKKGWTKVRYLLSSK